MKVKLLNKIDSIGINVFDKQTYTVSAEVESPDAILVRSAAMHDMKFEDNLLAIARAGAGVNNIPIDECSKQGIVVFNTPGANANGVKELAITALLLSSRKIVDGINWASSLKGQEGVAKLVESGKSKFVGPEIQGKTLGVIGLGAIGGLVANAASNLGMNVVGCDPYLTVDYAWSLSRSVKRAATFDEVFAVADYISIHVPSTAETKGMINSSAFALMKDGVRIINLSRADLVNATDIKEALASGKVASYVTDFPTEDVLGVDGVIAIPHLGASTPESEENCAFMAANQLVDYIENGNIKNSVNYPALSAPRAGKHRLVVLHENIPNMLASISSVLSNDNINIESLSNRSKGTNACSLFDTNNDVSDAVVADIMKVDGVTRVRVI